MAACQKGLSVGFITAAALVHELIEARDDKQLLRFQKKLATYKLLIVDELGFVPLSKTGAEFLGIYRCHARTGDTRPAAVRADTERTT